MNPFEQDLCAVIPAGDLGIVKLEHVEISREVSMSTALRAAAHPNPVSAYIPPGRYCRLTVGHTLMMTDTPMEKRSNREVIRQARGDVFIAGLGIGMILLPILKKPEVTSVTVVEKYQDVINLVAPALQSQPGGEKLTTVQGDVLDWRPALGTKYDTLYFDIWPDVCEDNLKEMTELHRAFRRHRRPGSWMDSWMRDTLKQMQKRRRRLGGFR